MSHYQRYTKSVEELCYTKSVEELLRGRKNNIFTEQDEDRILDNLEEWWYMLTPNERVASEEFTNALRKRIDDE